MQLVCAGCNGKYISDQDGSGTLTIQTVHNESEQPKKNGYIVEMANLCSTCMKELVIKQDSRTDEGVVERLTHTKLGSVWEYENYCARVNGWV